MKGKFTRQKTEKEIIRLEKFSKSRIGAKLTDKHKEALRNFRLGKKQSPELIEKRISKIRGRKQTPLAIATRSAAMIGVKKSPEHIAKLSGPNSYQWKCGISPLYMKIRNLPQNRELRISVYQRDKYTCCECHNTGGKLNSHHIKAFAQIIKENNIKSLEDAIICKELWDINNCVTLCEDCHKLTDTFLNKNNKKIKCS